MSFSQSGSFTILTAAFILQDEYRQMKNSTATPNWIIIPIITHKGR
ncbi:hypothetical protein SD77_1795 [Bacillus badius]|uniref:Uncharacterized protein n=1 Tax=Bacillus badius TaxID=1455 RepID=A0ABR5AS92_BACBA|nr:hypothetical protein SD78_2997 [Bacillus badius]KIL77043.1 hypothetical protein SD77_1795 [Bacillus badius]